VPLDPESGLANGPWLFAGAGVSALIVEALGGDYWMGLTETQAWYEWVDLLSDPASVAARQRAMEPLLQAMEKAQIQGEVNHGTR
jgi:hypothetical protein